MNIQQLINKTEATVLTKVDNKEITSGFVCDLISWVIANGKKGMAWVTVQTNINVVAVAALHDIACVVLPENIKMEGEPLKKARDEGIVVLSSPKSAYEICGILYTGGVR